MFHKARYVIKKLTKEQYDQQQQDDMNIFMTQHQDQEQSEYIRNGKVVPYLIVGNPEIFDQNKKTEQTKQLETKDRISSKRVIIKNNYFSQQEKQKDESSFIKIDMDGSEVEKEIERVIKNQNQPEPGVKNILTKPDITYKQKDDKIMKLYEQQQQQWNKRVIKSAQACKREPESSLFHHIDAERVKVEDKKLLDAIQTDSEKYGNRLWERQLRSSIQETNNKILEKGIEIIRKPNQPKVYKRPESYAKKFEERKEQVDKLIPQNSADNLMILGENKLIKESAFLLYLVRQDQNNKSNQVVTVQPSTKRKYIHSAAPFQKIVSKEQPLYYQEVLAMNYNKIRLRQQGQLDICKQIF